MAKLEIRSAYAYDVDAASDAVALHTGSESLVQQQFAEEVDINTIVKRFGLTGQMPEALVMPMSGDFLNAVTDFKSGMDMITEAQEEFMRLPADVRYRFANDPGRLIEFLENPNNRDEARKLGLLAPIPEVTRDAVKAIDDLAAKLVPPKG